MNRIIEFSEPGHQQPEEAYPATFRTALVCGLGALLLAITVGGGEPPVTAVPITEPWKSMALPIDSNAIVWGSTDSQVKILYQGAYRRCRAGVLGLL